MKTNLIRFALVATICSSVGCAMCCGPFDYDYPVYGGKHQRTDQTYGRVGSILSDPMASVSESADSNIKPITKESKPKQDDENSEQADKIEDELKRKLEKKSDDIDGLKQETKPSPEDNNTAFGRPRNRTNDNAWR